MMKVILTLSVFVVWALVAGCYPSGVMHELEQKKDMASTPEKREAITGIQKILRKYKRHDVAALKCADLILATNRNVRVIEKIAEYATVELSNTMDYVKIAEYAARSRFAADEFLEIAELIETHGGKVAIELARLTSQARDEEALHEVRLKINARRSERGNR